MEKGDGEKSEYDINNEEGKEKEEVKTTKSIRDKKSSSRKGCEGINRKMKEGKERYDEKKREAKNDAEEKALRKRTCYQINLLRA